MGTAMTRPDQRDLFAPTPEAPPEPFVFTGDGPELIPSTEPDDELSRWFNDPRHRWNQGDFG